MERTQEAAPMKFKLKDWVASAPVKRKGKFVGQVIDIIDGDYVVRDAERRKWLRTEAELSVASKEAA
jgi:hypothetical protein